jgi:hypothetical protein
MLVPKGLLMIIELVVSGHKSSNLEAIDKV